MGDVLFDLLLAETIAGGGLFRVQRQPVGEVSVRRTWPSYPAHSIAGVSGVLDHPLEPVIGRRVAPTRWRVMTATDSNLDIPRPKIRHFS
jgi:hypothetical protein